MKMKYTYLFLTLISMVAISFGCQEDDTSFGPVIAPTNLVANIEVATDQSGNVTVNPSADNAITFHVFFKEDLDPVVVGNGETAAFRYTDSGQYSQEIVVIAYGSGGASSSITELIDLDVILIIDQNVLLQLAGQVGEGKRWVWDSSNAGHFGVGDPAVNFPNFFSAGANQLDPCLYDDVLEFKYDSEGNYTYSLETSNATFMNWAEVKRFFPDATPQEFVDECRDLTGILSFETDFVVIEDAITGTSNLTVNNSTLSYWSGAFSYEIVELTDSKLIVRGLQDPFDPPGAQLAWYHTFVPEGAPAPICGAETGQVGNGNNDILVWAEEFDSSGAPCSDNWSYDLGTGSNGWGNNEKQYYTDSSSNVIVEGGVLKITAKAESFMGSNYTSTRLKSNLNFDFTYGKVETRAKLPTGGGTWPAIWLLGSDYLTNTWPGCGEIDLLEHIGNQQDVIFSTLHYPGNSGGNGVTESINVAGVSDEFHVYSVDWTPSEINFSVDGNVYHTFNNNGNLPFNNDFFLIVNVAMGGNFGGNIDPSFVASTLEVDYIRVYQ